MSHVFQSEMILVGIISDLLESVFCSLHYQLFAGIISIGHLKMRYLDKTDIILEISGLGTLSHPSCPKQQQTIMNLTWSCKLHQQLLQTDVLRFLLKKTRVQGCIYWEIIHMTFCSTDWLRQSRHHAIRIQHWLNFAMITTVPISAMPNEMEDTVRGSLNGR